MYHNQTALKVNSSYDNVRNQNSPHSNNGELRQSFGSKRDWFGRDILRQADRPSVENDARDPNFDSEEVRDRPDITDWSLFS